MTYRKFSENEEYKQSSSTEIRRLSPDVDIIPFTHTPDDSTAEDGKITISNLKDEFTADIVKDVTALQTDFISFRFLTDKPTSVGDLQKHILYFWKNQDTGIYKCFFVNELTDGTRSLGEIGGRTFYVGDLDGNKSTDSDTSEYGLTIDDVNGIISNALVQKGGTIHGNLTVAKNGTKNGDLKVNGKIDVDGDVSIGGNLTVEGTVTKADSISTENNYIKLREGATSALAEPPSDGGDNILSYTGLEAIHYDDDGNTGQLIFDKTGTARVGDKGKTQAIATRNEEAEMSDNELVFWNKTARRFQTNSTTVGDSKTPVYIDTGKPTICNDVISVAQNVVKSITYDGSVVNDTVQSDGTTGFAIDKNGKADLGAVTARGDTTIKGVLTASKQLDSTVKTNLKGTTSIGGTLNVTAATTITDAGSLTVNGKTTLGGETDVDGKATFTSNVDFGKATFDTAVSVAQGGTGQTTAASAFSNLAAGLNAATTDASDTISFITSKDGTAEISTTNQAQRRSGSNVWSWIKTKIANILGIRLATTTTENDTLAISKKVKSSSGFDGDIEGTATKANYPSGFNAQRSAKWNQIASSGTLVTGWDTKNNGSIAFLENSETLDVAIDGSYYQNEGRYKVIDSNSIGSSNAGTATKLATARTIQLQQGTNKSTAISFDGSADITLPLPSDLTAKSATTATSASKISRSDLTTETSPHTLIEDSGSSDTYKLEARMDTADNLEIRHTLGDDVSTSETWYSNTIKMMSLVPTTKQTVAIAGGNLTVNGTVAADRLEGTWQGYKNDLKTICTNQSGVLVLDGMIIKCRNIPTIYDDGPSTLSVKYATSAGSATSATTASSAAYATSAGSATSASSAAYATSAGSATSASSATKATQDSDGSQINTTYMKKSAFSVSGNTLTITY